MLKYRKGVGAIILNKEKQIFVAQRTHIKHVWQLPQGGIEPGETPEQTLFRELKEEIGTNNITILSNIGELSYDFPKELQQKFNRKGQSIVWFITRFEGQDEEINLNFTPQEIEFSDWKWLSFNEFKALNASFKAPMYSSIAQKLLTSGFLETV